VTPFAIGEDVGLEAVHEREQLAIVQGGRTLGERCVLLAKAVSRAAQHSQDDRVGAHQAGQPAIAGPLSRGAGTRDTGARERNLAALERGQAAGEQQPGLRARDERQATGYAVR